MSETQSHRRKIFFHLLAGNRLTGIEALQLFSCMRLGARMFEIKERGAPFESRYITVVGRNGKSKRVKEYWFDPENITAYKIAFVDGRLKI